MTPTTCAPPKPKHKLTTPQPSSHHFWSNKMIILIFLTQMSNLMNVKQ